MKYKPKRDISLSVRKLKTLSPTRIAEWVQENRTETDEFARKKQKHIRPEAITMYFKRHPDFYNKLAKEIANEELNGRFITEGIFQKKVFIKIPCIEKWILKMRGKGSKLKSGFVSAIKQVCLGQLPQSKQERKLKKPIEYIEDWGIKHPRKLTVEDGLHYISELMNRGKQTRRHRLALRNFFKSRNLEGWDEISGKMEQQHGKYAHLYVAPETLQLILQYIKYLNPIAYYACKFALKTACRMGGVQSAHSNKINYAEHTIWVTEKATKGNPKREQEKFIPQGLWEELDLDNFKGKLFNISEQELRDICKKAYETIIPELASEIPMPFHFWRHQFAQHGLRATNWNYALIAGLGHWTVETLERYYGKMDRQTRLQGARTFVHLIGTETRKQEIEILEVRGKPQPKISHVQSDFFGLELIPSI